MIFFFLANVSRFTRITRASGLDFVALRIFEVLSDSKMDRDNLEKREHLGNGFFSFLLIYLFTFLDSSNSNSRDEIF